MDESSEGNLWRVIEHSTKFEARGISTWAIQYSNWAHGIQLLLSMSKEEDICAVLRGAQRPSAESSITNSNSVGGGGDDDGGKKEGAMTVARWDRASSRLQAVLCLTTTGIPQGLVKRHGGNNRAGGIGNGPNGQTGWRELKAKYASPRVIRDALNHTQMSVGQDPDEYLNTLHQLRTDLQKEQGEVDSYDELEFIVIEHLTEEYDFVRTLFVTKDPEFDLPQIEATIQRTYMRRSRQAANTPKESGYCCCEPGDIKAKCRALQRRLARVGAIPAVVAQRRGNGARSTGQPRTVTPSVVLSSVLERNPWWRRCFRFEPRVARAAAAAGAAAHAVAVLDFSSAAEEIIGDLLASAPFPRQRGVSRW